MKRFLTAAVMAAAMFTGGGASAAVVVYDPTAGVPAGSALLTPVDIFAGVHVTTTEILLPGDSAEFAFTNIDTDEIYISDISLSGTGSNGGSDVGDVTYGLSLMSMSNFPFIIVSPNGQSAAGSATIPGFALASGDSFSIFWSDGIMAPVGVTASFSTSVVPLPAAGLLLVGALSALGLVRRKRTV